MHRKLRSGSPTRRRKGSALVTAILVFFVMVMLGVGLLALTTAGLRRGRLDALRARTLALADAGVEKAIFYLRTTAPDGSTDGSWRTNGRSESVGSAGSFTIRVTNGTGDASGKIVIESTGVAEDGAGAAGAQAAFLPWDQSSVRLASNDLAWPADAAGLAPHEVQFAAANAPAIGSTPQTPTSAGHLKLTRTLRVIIKLDREDVNIWNNAIFASVGQAGKSIQGNVMIRGSVHLLGDGETFTDTDGDKRWDDNEPYTDTNHNGKCDLGEPYTDADSDGHYDSREPFDDVNGNNTRDPALTVTDLAGDFGGNATLGNNYDVMPSGLKSFLPPITASSFKGESVESLNAKLRVKHGQVSLSGSATVGLPNAAGGSPARKETVNGTFVSDGWSGTAGAGSVYSDNGTKMTYNLGDLVKFPTLTAPIVKNGVSYASYMAYLRANALVVTGPLRIGPGKTYGPIVDARGNLLVVDSAGRITIRGMVYVEGDIYTERNGGNRSMTYSGRGTLISTGSVYVGTDLQPASYNFPVNNALGVIARKNIELATDGGDAQLTMAGAFYAQEKVVSVKQNQIAGTFVSSFFEMTNVPSIYQVPSLPDNLPPGMPGDGRIWIKTVRIDSWRELPNSNSASLVV